MAAPKKKNAKKNSNYKPVYKYVTADQMCRKVLCDYRNMPEPKDYLGESKDVDDNIYNCAVNFCVFSGAITEAEKAELFEGKNHVPMSNEEISEFTGIPVYQIEKNLFAFKAKNDDEATRAGMIRLAFMDIVTEKINEAKENNAPIGEMDMRKIAAYINFCVVTGIMDEEQSTSVYFMAKELMQVSPAYVAAFTGLDPELIQKMAQA
ncbi:MAG: hypothetical protein IKV96_04885 [Firmicutes bacterium]|nr:hypothetical protein [Bacillota bacterium]